MWEVLTDTGTDLKLIQYAYAIQSTCIAQYTKLTEHDYSHKKGISLIYNFSRFSTLAALLIYSYFSHLPVALAAEDVPVNNSFSTLGNVVSDDYKTFFASDRLIRLGIAFGAGAVMANTNADMNIRNWYQENVRSTRTNDWSSSRNLVDNEITAKFFGEGKYMVPVALLAASINSVSTDTAIGNWGANASRAYIVGLPAMWGMQFATGAARPSHNAPSGSAWRPFNKDGYAHGVSGHSFVGAVPFLTIAAMNPDNDWVRYPAYLASAAAGWSRVNDDAHFTSQVILGWYMAWEAVDSVFENNTKKQGIRVAPMSGLDGFGLMANVTW